jgi:hypothetical protein
VTPTEAMVALAIMGNAGAWAKVFVDGRKYRANGKGCGAPEVMREHCEILTTHTVQINGIKEDVSEIKADVKQLLTRS